MDLGFTSQLTFGSDQRYIKRQGLDRIEKRLLGYRKLQKKGRLVA
jgi:hypothetical protein